MVNKATHIILQFFADDTVKWYQVDDLGVMIDCASHTDLSAIPAILPKERLIVLLPGIEIFSVEISIPKTSWQNVLKAVPFLLEEHVAVAVEHLHIALAKSTRPEYYLINAIDREKFEKYLARLEVHHLKPTLILPDFLALTYHPASWTVKFSDDFAWVRTSRTEGFACKRDLVHMALQLKAKNALKPVICEVIGKEAELMLMHLGDDFNLKRKQAQSDFDPEILTEKPVINLLQGKYRVKQNIKTSGKYSRFSLCVMIVWLSVLFGGKFLEGYFYHLKNKMLNQQISTLLPNVSKEEIKIEMQRRLHALSQGNKTDPCIDLLGQVGKVVKSHANIDLISIAFNDEQLKLEIRAEHLQSLENFTRALEEQPIQIKRNRLRTEEKFVAGELTIAGDK